MARREKALFIVNPKSGKMTIKDYLFKILKLFSDNGFVSTVLMTTKNGDASEFAKKYGPKFDRIISCGGDGTLNEIVTGIMSLDEKDRRPLGFIPVGTTNDLADTLRIPKAPVEAAECIIKSKPVPQDIGLFGENRYFNYVASCGAFTSTSYATSQDLKNSLGHLAYVLEGLKSLSEIKPIHMKIRSDELTTEGNFLFAGVTNSMSVGGIYKFDPKHVNLSDGIFEVILIREPKKPEDLVNIFYRLSNLEYDESQVVFFHTSSLTFTADEPVGWTVDGEYGGKIEKVEIKNLPGAIKIFKPKIEEPVIAAETN